MYAAFSNCRAWCRFLQHVPSEYEERVLSHLEGGGRRAAGHVRWRAADHAAPGARERLHAAAGVHARRRAHAGKRPAPERTASVLCVPLALLALLKHQSSGGTGAWLASWSSHLPSSTKLTHACLQMPVSAGEVALAYLLLQLPSEQLAAKPDGLTLSIHTEANSPYTCPRADAGLGWRGRAGLPAAAAAKRAAAS